MRDQAVRQLGCLAEQKIVSSRTGSLVMRIHPHDGLQVLSCLQHYSRTETLQLWIDRPTRRYAFLLFGSACSGML